MTDKNTLKSWFQTNLKPTQAQFWAWIDSFYHKDEKIPITAIDELETILNEKADAEALTNHVGDANAHAELFAEPNARLDDLEAKTDTENNWKTITGYSLNPATRVLTMDAGWEGIINGIDYTNAAAVPLPAITLAAAGYSRIDLIVFNTAGTFVIVPGIETVNTPVKPAKLTNTLEATFVTVSDGVVNVPVIPKPKAPVTSVNGMRGEVVLNAINDLVTGGIYDFLSAEQGKVLKTQIDGINTLLTSNDVNLDTVQEIVTAIKTVQTSLSTILVNDLTTGGTTKALTAEMGKTLKGLIDGLTTNKVDKVAGERLINAAEITKLAGVTNVTTTVKSILSTALATQTVAGFVTYINALTPVLVVGANEIVEYQLSDTGRLFKLLLRGRSFGVGQAAIVAADVEEATLWMSKDLKLSNYPNTRDDGANPTNKVLGTDVNGNIKSYSMTGFPAPYLSEMIPDSNLPSTTFNVLLKGDFFTPGMTIVYAGQTVVSKTFISSKEYRISLTSGSVEGSYSITLNNGVSITYPNAFLVVLGEVYIPVVADFTSVSSTIDVTDGKLTTNTVNALGSANLNIPFDMTKKWRVYTTMSHSPLIAPISGENIDFFVLQNVTAGTAWKVRMIYDGYAFYMVIQDNSNTQVTGAISWSVGVATFTAFIEWNLTDMKVYYNNALVYTFPNGTFGSNFALKMQVKNKDLKSIKRVLLPM